MKTATEEEIQAYANNMTRRAMLAFDHILFYYDPALSTDQNYDIAFKAVNDGWTPASDPRLAFYF